MKHKKTLDTKTAAALLSGSSSSSSSASSCRQFSRTYYARHSQWQDPFTLLEDGTFVGGPEFKPNGCWKTDDGWESLTIRWHSWQEEKLYRNTASGYSGEQMTLEPISPWDPRYESHRVIYSRQYPARGLYSYLTTGVCDRLNNILFLKNVAEETGRSLYWGWPSSPTCNCSFNKLFECHSIHVMDARVPIGVQISERGPRLSEIELKSMVAKHDAEAWVFVEERYFGHNFDNLDLIIRPSHEVSSLVHAYVESQWQSAIVGVHVRRGDKVEFTPPLSAYFREIDPVIDAIPDVRFFLCSDDQECETAIRGRYGNRVLSYPVRSFERASEVGIIDAVVCLYLLRCTNGVIGSSMSGYSLCAGWDCGFIDVASSYQNHPLRGDDWKFPVPKFKLKQS